MVSRDWWEDGLSTGIGSPRRRGSLQALPRVDWLSGADCPVFVQPQFKRPRAFCMSIPWLVIDLMLGLGSREGRSVRVFLVNTLRRVLVDGKFE